MSICPGCENEIEENDGYVTYFGALWHVVCACEDYTEQDGPERDDA